MTTFLVENWLSIKYNFSFSIWMTVLLFIASELLVTDAFMLKREKGKKPQLKVTIKCQHAKAWNNVENTIFHNIYEIRKDRRIVFLESERERCYTRRPLKKIKNPFLVELSFIDDKRLKAKKIHDKPWRDTHFPFLSVSMMILFLESCSWMRRTWKIRLVISH